MRIYVVLGISALAACASQEPTRELVASSAAIRTAEAVGASKEPSAALHLQLARDQTDRARQLIADGDRTGAERLLRRAEADANLAVALARSADEQQAARSAIDRVNELKGSYK